MTQRVGISSVASFALKATPVLLLGFFGYSRWQTMDRDEKLEQMWKNGEQIPKEMYGGRCAHVILHP